MLDEIYSNLKKQLLLIRFFTLWRLIMCMGFFSIFWYKKFGKLLENFLNKMIKCALLKKSNGTLSLSLSLTHTHTHNLDPLIKEVFCLKFELVLNRYLLWYVRTSVMWVLKLVMCPLLVSITQNLILLKSKLWNQGGTKTKVKEVKGIGRELFPFHFFLVLQIIMIKLGF